MKLLQHTGRYYLIFSSFIFILSGIVLFLALRYVVQMESDEQLMDTRVILKKQLHQLDSIPPYIALLDNLVEITPVDTFNASTYFVDTSFWSGMDKEHESPYRKFIYHDSIKGKPYQIALNRNNLDTEEMLTTVVFWIIGILTLLLIMINLFNRFLSLQIWQPFYQSINQLKRFSFNSKVAPEPVPTNIDEFKILQKAIGRMTNKILKDYQSLKQFTENASHEIQTPLAIIKNKVEMMLQHEDIKEQDLREILHIHKAANRISKLNQALVLLIQIENRQYVNNKRVNIKNLVEEMLLQIEPMLSAKQLVINTQLEDVSLMMDPVLAEVLLQNLIGNAMKHNIMNGSINIQLEKKRLRIQNSGAALNIDTQSLFERFQKGVDASPSLGLGLAIVYEICQNYGFGLDYQNEGDQHQMDVSFLEKTNDGI